MSDLEDNSKWWQGMDLVTAVRECKRLDDENYELIKDRTNLRGHIYQLENYIKFKGLKEEFNEWTKK